MVHPISDAATAALVAIAPAVVLGQVSSQQLSGWIAPATGAALFGVITLFWRRAQKKADEAEAREHTRQENEIASLVRWRDEIKAQVDELFTRTAKMRCLRRGDVVCDSDEPAADTGLEAP